MRRTVSWKAAFFEVLGLLMIVGGGWAFVWGLQRLDDPPIPVSGYKYATTEQLAAMSTGGAIGLLGWLAFRHGRSLSDD